MTWRHQVQTLTGYLRLDPSPELRGPTLFGFSAPSFLLVTPSAICPFLTVGCIKIMYFVCILWLCMLFVYSIYKQIKKVTYNNISVYFDRGTMIVVFIGYL